MTGNQNFHIYINDASGTVINMGRSALTEMIGKSRLPIESVHFLKPDAICDEIKKNGIDSNTKMIIGGGDGTIRSCAAQMMGTGQAFGILPLGTMNLMAKDLNIPTRIQNALDAYAAGTKTIDIDVGQVNDDIFLCCAGLGTIPEASKVREQHRDDEQPVLITRMTAYLLKQMDPVNRKKLTLKMNGRRKRIKTSALVVSNNQYGPQGQWNEENFKRISLQDGILGIYSVAPYSLWDKMRFLMRLGLGDWRQDKALREWRCKELTVRCKDRPVLLSLDGETEEFNSPLKFTVLPKKLKLLIPERSET